MQLSPPAVFHDKYQWEIWKNTAGKSAIVVVLNTKGNKQLHTTDCRVRLQLHNLKVDAIVTHLIGDTIDNEGKDVNEKKRQKQAKELIEFANSRETQADLIILGGDLNLKPVHKSYKIINSDESGFEDTKVRNTFTTNLIARIGQTRGALCHFWTSS